MLRRIMLVVMAVFVSYALTAASGYVLYVLSGGLSEGSLSLMVLFFFSPLVAILVGLLVGFLSKDYAPLMATVGLAPWALMFHGLARGGLLSGWLRWAGPILFYLGLGAGAAAWAWRVRHRQIGS